MGNFKDKNYKVTFNPGLSECSPGEHWIKTDDDIETPLALVPVPLGIRAGRMLSEEKAKWIVECLNQNSKTGLLNLKCSQTGEIIQEGEFVAMHDWGIRTHDKVIGYGAYVWDEQDRAFTIDADTEINRFLDCDTFFGIESRYDMFRTTPRKLTDEEREKIEHLI